jgi:hypothetical protein
MRRRSGLAFVIVGWLFGSMIGGGGHSLAHTPASDWYETKWGGMALPKIPFKFHTGFPTGGRGALA